MSADSTRVGQAVATVRDSFWFIPALCMLASIVLIESLTWLDRRLASSDLGFGWVLLQAGASGSRSLLAAIATSMLAAAATTFSITIAVLALTSSSYGPRLVGNFMADRGNQLVLGVLVATSLYALLLLRHIRVLDPLSDDDAFVPHVAVNVAVLLAVVSMGALVYFIHHISVAIQVSTLSEAVSARTADLIEQIYPDRSDDAEATAGFDLTGPDSMVVTSPVSGYVQGIDRKALCGAAREHRALVEVTVRPGDFRLAGEPVALVRGDGSGEPTDAEWLGDVSDAVRSALLEGPARTPYQDIGFVVQQQVDLVVRALSPGTNDPVTALNALDELSIGLAAIAARPGQQRMFPDSSGVPRLRVAVTSATELLDGTVDLIRPYAVAHPVVVGGLLRLLGRVGARATSADVQAAVRLHVAAVVEAVQLRDDLGARDDGLVLHWAQQALESVGRPITEVQA